MQFEGCRVMFDHSVCEAEAVVDQTDDQLSEHEDTMISDEQNHITEIRGEIRHTSEDGQISAPVLHRHLHAFISFSRFLF